MERMRGGSGEEQGTVFSLFFVADLEFFFFFVPFFEDS